MFPSKDERKGQRNFQLCLLRSQFQAKLETKALKAKRPGFTDDRYNETAYYAENGTRSQHQISRKKAITQMCSKIVPDRFAQGLSVLLHVHNVHQGPLGGGEDPGGLRPRVPRASRRGIRACFTFSSAWRASRFKMSFCFE